MKMIYVIFYSKDKITTPISATLQEGRAGSEVVRLNKIELDEDPKSTGWYYYLPVILLDKDCLMDFKQ
jgi:hypothetical protein